MCHITNVRSELDRHRKTFEQVEPTPELAPGNPEEPNGHGGKKGMKTLLNFYFFI